MNWIKDNPFLSALLGITLGLSAAFVFIGIKGGWKFDAAKTSFDEAFAAVQKSEGLPLYPHKDNVTAKKKALDDHCKSIDEMREDYKTFMIDPEAPPITTQQFTENLKKAAKEVEDAFSAAESKLPEGFFMGFEAYRGELAKSGATTMLDYQLKAVKHLLLGLAESRPTSMIRIYRERISEESDQPYVPGENEVARKFSYEIAVRGSEESIRHFISKLGEKKSFFFVIRSIRINNERDVPPRISDAKFEKPAPAAVDPAAIFGAGFFEEEKPEIPAAGPNKPENEVKPEAENVLPGEALPAEGAGAELGAAAGGVAEPEQPITIPTVTTDSSKILSQVLGDEELLVFVRFDILIFSPTKELVKP
jgi:hypothetical protein